MRKPSPLSVDFAAIRTLRMVFDLGSFSKAAEILDVNQSSVSYTVDRLRQVFRDPLFVRQGGGIAPTGRCIELVERCGRLLDEFEALAAPLEFDPDRASDSVAIACNYYERILLLPLVIEELRRRAQGLAVDVTTAGSHGIEYLKRGEVDLLIGPYRVDNEDFHYQPLFNDQYVCVMDEKNPLNGEDLSVKTYIGANHAVVTYGGTWRSPYLVELDRQSLTLNQKLGVPSLSDLANVLPGTDLISTVPSRISKHLGAAIAVSKCPVPASFRIGLIWTSRTHHAAAHKWVREVIARVCNHI